MDLSIISNVIAFFVYSYVFASIEHSMYFFSDKTYYFKINNPVITAFPLFGIGVYIILFINSLLDKYNISNIIIKFLIFASICTSIEYIVGSIIVHKENGLDCAVMGWDYSDVKYNYKGIISLKHFILWGLAGLIIILIHPHLIHFIKAGLLASI